MMKKILFIFVACLFSTFCFASSASPRKVCAQAFPTTHPGFCQSFKDAAACHCENFGASAVVCQSMTFVYGAMIGRYLSIAAACAPANQSYTSPQVCMDDWKCYREGGRDSRGGLCSSTGRAC